MLIKSGLITQGSGSIGGLTASHNRGGLYLRSRTIPTDPNTFQQAVNRALFSDLSSRWKNTLTQVQRDDWKTYADNTPRINVLGDSIILAANQMYLRCNQARVVAGLTRVDDAPTNFGDPEMGSVTFTVSEATQNGIFTFNDGNPWASEDDAGLIILASRPMSPSIGFFKGPFQSYTFVAGDSMSPPTSPNTRPVWPFPLVESQRVYARCRVSDTQGRLSAPTIVTTLVTA